MKYHPDVNVGAVDANAKFQSIKAAYDLAMQAAEAAQCPVRQEMAAQSAARPSKSEQQKRTPVTMADFDASFFAFAQAAVGKSLRPENNMDEFGSRRQRAACNAPPRGGPAWA